MLIRWLKFNAVGILGVGVQLAALSILVRRAHFEYLIATALAVEIAILHNFIWHEAWTWRNAPREERWRRLMRFHLGNGLMSIAGNVVFTSLYKQAAGLPLIAANLLAILTTAAINFCLAQFWVFRSSPIEGSDRIGS